MHLTSTDLSFLELLDVAASTLKIANVANTATWEKDFINHQFKVYTI